MRELPQDRTTALAVPQRMALATDGMPLVGADVPESGLHFRDLLDTVNPFQWGRP